MPHSDLNRLRGIKTLPSLLAYLRDELDWPIDSDAVEDSYFEYDPAELGFDEETTVHIKEVKQLRPLHSGQPWGVFWVNFEKKRLPVVMLRRALGHLVVKKRASSNKADQRAWRMNDLLFISAYGEDNDRAVTFAHFSEDQEAPGGLPVLKVLGWDDTDTVLHLADAHRVLTEKLRWPAKPGDVSSWRQQWSSAFTLRHREVITTTDELVEELAKLAKEIRKAVLFAVSRETDRGAWRKLLSAFQATLIHDLDEDSFADVIAQTISYGLLTARFSTNGTITLKNLVDMVPRTNPFLKELLGDFVNSAGRRRLFDVDEVGIDEVVSLLNAANADAIKNDFGNKTRGEDPVIHFYEHFLEAYNKEIKVQRGVFYTPQPVVSYIVRSVHELLQTEFGLADGLADTTTWGEMLKKHPDLKLPPLTDEPGEKRTIKPDEPFVQILDPATGTATFLVEVIEIIYRTLEAKWKQQSLTDAQQCAAWNDYVPKHLLPRLHAFELMMAPYAIAHMKVGLKLTETGYLFGNQERAHIYLTNALEPWVKQLPLIGFDALAHEAASVNKIKQFKRFTVIIGNPPYSGISANMSDTIIDLVKPYKEINGVSLGERKIWAQDDYKKFIRFGQLGISRSGCGTLSFITNHGFINEPTSRGMRHNLLSTFTRTSVLDLHGSLKKREVCLDGSPDKNVFDIEPGVAISFFRRQSGLSCGVAHCDLWGTREVKYAYLQKHTLRSTKFLAASPSEEFYLFVPQREDAKIEFSELISVTEVFESGSNGIQTSRDHVVYGFNRSDCRATIEEFRAPERTVSTSAIRDKYWLGKKVANYAPGDTRGWRVPTARDELRRDTDWEAKFKRALYRPFDFQTLFYADYMIDWPRTEIMSQMLRPNLSLCVGRAGSAADSQDWNIVFVADALVDMNLFYRGGNVNYPLRVAARSDSFDFDGKARPNLKPVFLKALAAKFGITQADEFGVPHGLTPESVLHYIYAIFHSPGYRSRYAEFLKIDFPRLPLTGNIDLFHALARLGGELVALHLLQSPALNNSFTEYVGVGSPKIEKISWSNNTVWVDKAQHTGFKGVPEDVWKFHVGGYQVCEKWLKDRKGRNLSASDRAHYQKLHVALAETIRLMKAIDAVIEKHGGWPLK